MSDPLPKIKKTCISCLDPVFDLGCPCTERVERYRMGGACDCTCKTMGFKSCAVTTPIEDCSCIDATTEPSSKITGVWIGFSDATTGHTLADIVRSRCPAGSRALTYELYGTTWNFTTHRTNQDMNCLTDLTGMTLLWTGTDTPANSLSICDGGAIFLTAGELDIRTIPTPGGTGTDCTQEGGSEMFVMKVTDCRGIVVQCNFAGVIGARFTCQKYDRCCRWNIDLGVLQSCDGATPGTALITVNATRTLTCECVPVTTVRIDVGGPTDHTYTLTGTSFMVTHTVTPCLPLANVQVDITNTYDDCADCAELNGTETVFLQI